jgi:uncharacterized iron-regulated protein
MATGDRILQSCDDTLPNETAVPRSIRAAPFLRRVPFATIERASDLHMIRLPNALAALARAALLAVLTSASVPARAGACPVPGQWMLPAADAGTAADFDTVMRVLGERRVVLLGEHHDSADHHRWQLHTASALMARSRRLVLALEMFPRSVQPALDRWVAGGLGERDFLRASGWSRVWRFDPQLYMPLFHFARLHRIPMVALNVDPELTHAVAQRGFDNVAELADEGISRPTPALPAYRHYLKESFGAHGAHGGSETDEQAFERFVESQLTWDRAMAQGIVDALERHPGARVVGILGSGHVFNGWGVEHQLASLGVPDVASLLPSDVAEDCATVAPGHATAVFGMVADGGTPTERPRLGVWLEPIDRFVSVQRVLEGSVAADAGLEQGDLLVEVGGLPCENVEDVIERVQAQAPGSWLPMRVRRAGRVIDLVARFPASH